MRRPDRADDEGSESASGGAAKISGTELILAICGIRSISERVVTDKFSPALCELVYRAHQREKLRDKLLDLQIAAAAATNSGMVTNAADIIRDTREAVDELLSKPLLPDDDGR